MATLKLPLDLYSPDQLGILLVEANEHLSAIRDASVRAKTAGRVVEIANPHTSALMTGILQSNDFKANDPQSYVVLSKGFTIVRDKAPVAHLTLAALPNRTLKRQLVEWFRQNVNPYMLLTFAVRTDIGGGVVVRVGSRIYDFSFRQQILGNKHRISEIYANVRQ